ncbi:MAG TPA: LLM class flavin-dependent oxidoreductase [Trebonia sp.]|jgi:alkanesulfonate monooxygenase SsuD/methylene tetrahydromethanopterin reductase-like flavin-dependent oxidoreductase (luciferase family)|nr:LLM class flavin-dependent oxidoreductase [Trebonia sp.]
MRLHLNFGILGADGMPLGFAEIAARARLIEDAGFSGIWSGHHIPIPGDTARTLPDPLMGLLIAASATARVELGTCIYCLGLVNAGNFAQSAYTLESFAPGRVTFGVGTGSQKQEWDVAGLDWSQRFARMDESIAFVKAMFTGESAIEVEELTFGDSAKKYDRQKPPSLGEPTLAQKIGSPRFLLGTWRSPAQLRRAATVYDGWLGSAGPGTLEGGWQKVFTESMRRFRDAGGTRALVSTMLVDHEAPTTPLRTDGTFELVCQPAAITERLAILDELGFSDVILSPWDSAAGKGRPLTADLLARLRALYPVDATTACTVPASPVPASPVPAGPGTRQP